MLPPTHERTTNARMQPVVNMQGRAPPPQRQQQQQQPYAYQPPPQPAAPPSQQPHQHGGGGGGWDSDWDRQQQQQQQPPHQQQTSGGNFGGGGFGGDGFGGSENFSGSGYSADSISGQMAAPPSKAGGGMPSVSSSGFLLGQGEADELPILEDLGINFQHIKEKTKIVLWPKRSMLTSTSEIVQDDDFAGPLLFCLALATLLLFKGKVHFGTIYGVFAIGLVGLWAMLNLMSQRGIDMLRTASIMGYCLLPIVFLAALSIPIQLQGVAGWIFIPLAVLWCANAASLFFVAALNADDRRWLLAYPVAMFYTCFALITIF